MVVAVVVGTVKEAANGRIKSSVGCECFSPTLAPTRRKFTSHSCTDTHTHTHKQNGGEREKPMAFSVVEQESIEKRLCVVVRLLFSPQGDALIAICRPQCVRGSGRVDVK